MQLASKMHPVVRSDAVAAGTMCAPPGDDQDPHRKFPIPPPPHRSEEYGPQPGGKHDAAFAGGQSLRATVVAVAMVAAATTAAASPQCPAGTYLADSGDCVQSPTGAPSPAVGATTMCGDGTYSFSQNRSGTCSHHEGVAQWLTGAPAHAVPALPAAAIPPPIDDSDEFVALAISPNTGLVGCDTRQLAQDLRPGLSPMLLAPAQQGWAGSVRSFRPGTT